MNELIDTFLELTILEYWSSRNFKDLGSVKQAWTDGILEKTCPFSKTFRN